MRIEYSPSQRDYRRSFTPGMRLARSSEATTPEQRDRLKVAQTNLDRLYNLDQARLVRHIEMALHRRSPDTTGESTILARLLTPEDVRTHYHDFSGPMVAAEQELLSAISNPNVRLDVLSENMEKVTARSEDPAVASDEQEAAANRIAQIAKRQQQYVNGFRAQ